MAQPDTIRVATGRPPRCMPSSETHPMPTSIFAPPSNWPTIATPDVAVIGAGIAGIGAACAAAKLGADVLLIDRMGFPGGVASACCCPYLMGFSVGDRQVIGGVADELVRVLDSMGQARLRVAPMAVPDSGPIGDRPLLANVITSVEGVRLAALQLLERAGARTLFYTRLIGALTEDGRIAAAAVDCAEGPGLIRARTFVDATGDANLVYRAGGAVREAPADESVTKTILIRVGGVVGFDVRDISAAFKARVDAGTVPLAAQDQFMGMALLNPGEALLNFTLTIGDGLTSAELTRMDRELREQVPMTVEWFRSEMPGFAECFLVDSAVNVGVRCGRSIVGHETITMESIDENPPVAEPVALGSRGYGGHGLAKFRSPWSKYGSGPRGIPWRALLPVGLENVAVGGRGISCDHRVIDTIRLMARCMATGQAAGVTAALAAQSNSSCISVGYDAVRDALLDQSAILA